MSITWRSRRDNACSKGVSTRVVYDMLEKLQLKCEKSAVTVDGEEENVLS